MKKIVLILLSFVMLLSLCACGSDDTQTTEPSTTPSQTTTDSTQQTTDGTEGTTEATQAPTEEPTTAPTEKPTTPPSQVPTEAPTTPPTTQPATCNHSWKDATCTAPKTCKTCGATEGKAAGHSWKDATCTAPKTCSKCGATEGSAAGHSWKDATCSAPKTCSKCGATEGKAAGHSWKDATCTAPKTCSKCGVTEGSAAGHNWNDATCTAPKTCTKCGVTEGVATDHNWKEDPAGSQKPNCLYEGFTYYVCTACKEISIVQLGFGDHTYGEWHVRKAPTCTEEGQEYRECIYAACRYKEYRSLEATTKHSWDNATCTAPKTCKTCGATEGSAAGHSWNNATCTAPKTCKTCGATEGSAAGHSWNAATCTAPKTCKTCGATEGSAAGHSWNNATCTAPKTCKTCGATEGSAAGHSWKDATCANPKTCSKCGIIEGDVEDHSLKADGLCKWCNQPIVVDPNNVDTSVCYVYISSGRPFFNIKQYTASIFSFDRGRAVSEVTWKCNECSELMGKPPTANVIYKGEEYTTIAQAHGINGEFSYIVSNTEIIVTLINYDNGSPIMQIMHMQLMSDNTLRIKSLEGAPVVTSAEIQVGTVFTPSTVSWW